MEIDFYSELRKLLFGKPANAMNSRSVENCTYGDYLYRCKNAYLSYFLTDSQDCYYSEYLYKSRDCIDCAYLSSSEMCLECVDGNDLYDCQYLQDCHGCARCSYCLDCFNCKDCFGCFGLRHKQFCIFNKPYTEADYHAKLAELKKHPPAKVLKILAPEFEKHPRIYARLLRGADQCFGDYIYFSKKCFQCYNVRNVEDSAYVSEIMNPEQGSATSMDCTFVTNVSNCYECQTVSQASNCNFLEHCANCSDSEYLRYCYNCSNCFGCVYLSNKEYCILNRQFTRDEYLVALAEIKKQLKGKGLYGKHLAEILA